MTILSATGGPTESVILPPARDLGDGFKVRRALPSVQRRMVGPFIFLDHFGPMVFRAGAGLDVRPHPHIGLSTLSYLLEGEMIHRDSAGNVETIRAGDVNWMALRRKDRARRTLRTMSRRAELYKTFIVEASRLYADALANDKCELSKLVDVHALIARMELLSTDSVVGVAGEARSVDCQYLPAPQQGIC